MNRTIAEKGKKAGCKQSEVKVESGGGAKDSTPSPREREGESEDTIRGWTAEVSTDCFGTVKQLHGVWR